MLKFFDLIFYHLYKFYAKHKERGALSSSAGIVGGFYACNVMMLLMVLALISQTKIYFSSTLAILGLIIFFQITTYIRYVYKETITPEIIKERWSKKTDSQKSMLRFLIFIYILISSVGLFGLAIYLGSKEW